MSELLDEEVPRDDPSLNEHYFDLIDGTDHPVILDSKGVYRWKANPLIQWIADRIDLNEMNIAHEKGMFSREDLKQFYRDMGYSLCGFADIWGWKDDDGDQT